MAPVWTLLALLLVLAPVATAEPWLQYGYDAAHTSATPDPGPATYDVAFTVDLPGVRTLEAVPVILDGTVYVLTRVSTEEGNQEGGVWRVDLETAEVSPLVDLTADGPAFSAFLSDGERLFVAAPSDLRAYDVATGALAWAAPYPAAIREPVGITDCQPGVVWQHMLILPCDQIGGEGGVSEDSQGTCTTAGVGGICRATAVVAAWDRVNGDLLWAWTEPPPAAAPLLEGGSTSAFTAATAVAVIGGQAYVVVEEAPDANPSSNPCDGSDDLAGDPPRLWALDAHTGRTQWGWSLHERGAGAVNRLDGGTEPPVPGALPGVTGTPDEVYVTGVPLMALDPSTGCQNWVLPRPDGSGGATADPGGPLALFDRTLYVGSLRGVTHVDTATRNVAWTALLPDGVVWTDDTGFVLANGILYGSTTGGRIFGFDTRDEGNLVYERLEPNPTSVGPALVHGVGEGVLVITSRGGQLTVVGHTAASIQLAAAPSESYPDPGATVTIDVGATRPGAQDNLTEYQVNWGDGTVTAWGPGPTFEHVYERAGDQVAQVRARNEAGQEASRTVEFHVGEEPPQELNALQKAFARENQDLTFGVLGVALALGGGAIAIARQRTRRRRIQRELEAIDAAYADTRDRPLDCEAALAERRAHVRGLGLDGKLDQSEVLLLERRIDELGQQLRLESIDEQFGFLTVNMARTLREMLADGRISAWEREHFLDALDADGHLTVEQKGRVRDQIDAWFAQDAGADA